MSMLRITDSVGIGAKNKAEDIKAVQTALNKILHLIPPTQKVIVNGSLGSVPANSNTVKAIKAFQRQILRYAAPDGKIDLNGKTHKKINEKLKLVSPASSITTIVPWMKTALGQLGHQEVAGSASNPQIMAYIKSSKMTWAKDDSSGKNAWCGAFVYWVMKQHGYPSIKHPYRAKDWASFGKKVPTALHGAIAIKDRARGGHVGFVVGKNSDGSKLFILGGNQSNRVSIARYPASDFHTFVVPTDFDTSTVSLPIYTAPAVKAGSEV